jgi:hypothetical protein
MLGCGGRQNPECPLGKLRKENYVFPFHWIEPDQFAGAGNLMTAPAVTRPRPFTWNRDRDGAPTALALVPRCSPAGLPSATAQTLVGPRCCCTSAISGDLKSHSIATASLTAGSILSAKRYP